jgi:micrococcal nuclease
VVAATPTNDASRGWLVKAACAVVALVLVAGVVSRFRSEDSATPTPNADIVSKLIPTGAPPSRATTLSQSQSAPAGLPSGFVPVPWATSLPDGVIQGTVDYVVDGDTFEIVVNGVSARYRIYHADTPETYPDVECGGPEATAFSKTALWSSDTPGQVWIESVDQRDKYGRKLAYLWFTSDGRPYLLNYVLINSGWAEDIDYGDAFDPYREQLRQAAGAARQNNLGVWELCGGFGHPAAAPLAVATSVPALDKIQPPAANLAGDCNPNYSPCVPNVSYDIDCKDVGFRVQVIGSDPYNLDNDDPDLIGCESYP